MLAFMNLTCGHTSNTSSREEIKGHDIFVYIPQACMKLILRPRASNYIGRDSSLFSMRSLNDRRHGPTLLLHINRRKVEVFIHSVIILHWPLRLQQLSTSDYR